MFKRVRRLKTTFSANLRVCVSLREGKQETQGVLGDKFVAMQPGSSAEATVDGDVLHAKEDQGLAQVVERSSIIVDSVSRTTKKIDDFASGLPDAGVLKAAISDLAASAKALREMMDQMNQKSSMVSTLNDPANAKTLESTLKHLSSAAKRMDSIGRKIDEGQGTLGALVNDRTLYEDLRAKLGQVDRGRVARKAFQQGQGPVAPSSKQEMP